MGRLPDLRSRWFTDEPATRARWALLVVALVEVALFALQHGEQWHTGRALLPTSQVRAGEGLVVRGDGLGYYAWLRSLLIDGDWSFENEFDEHNPWKEGVPRPQARTEVGRRPNPWSVGPACVWAVTVVPGHLLVQRLQGWGLPWAADGYSLPYQLLVGLTTLLVSLAGLLFLNGICRRYARPVPAALAAALLTLGTTIVYYSAVEVTMAHGLGTAVLAALVWYWLTTYGSTRPARWLLVGALLGLAALMRWQLASFALLPAGEALIFYSSPARSASDGAPRRWRSGLVRLLLLGLAGTTTIFAFTPQMIAWHCVYGHWLVSPIRLSHNWFSPALWEVLGSPNRSLFYWTPLALLAGVGGLACLSPWLRVAPRAPLVLLAVAFAGQVYVLSCIRGTGVVLGSAYGFRQLTESLVVLAPGLAVLLDRVPPGWYRRLAVLGCVLVLWNLVLICEYRYLLLPRDAGASPEQLLSSLLRLVHNKPLLLVVQIPGPLLLGWLLRDRGDRGAVSSGATGLKPAA